MFSSERVNRLWSAAGRTDKQRHFKRVLAFSAERADALAAYKALMGTLSAPGGG